MEVLCALNYRSTLKFVWNQVPEVDSADKKRNMETNHCSTQYPTDLFECALQQGAPNVQRRARNIRELLWVSHQREIKTIQKQNSSQSLRFITTMAYSGGSGAISPTTPFHSLPVDQVLSLLGVQDKHQGLSSEQSAKALQLYGRNELPPEEGTPLWKLVVKQFEDVLVRVRCFDHLVLIMICLTCSAVVDSSRKCLCFTCFCLL